MTSAGSVMPSLLETTESINARLAGAKQAHDQIRFALGIMAVISMMLFIASYNAYLSFDHSWALEVGPRHFTTDRTPPDILTEQALRSWSDARTVSISLLGIRVNVDDAPVLGTLSLLVVSVWLLLATRRENGVIECLLHDTVSVGTSPDLSTSATVLLERRTV